MADADSLKGMWNGSFRYSATAEIGETEFKARFTISNGAVTGLIVEDHVVRQGQVKAEIEGTFDGRILHFTKRYIDDGNEYTRPVKYEGTMAADGQSIEGTWTLPDDSGTFVMTRP